MKVSCANLKYQKWLGLQVWIQVKESKLCNEDLFLSFSRSKPKRWMDITINQKKGVTINKAAFVTENTGGPRLNYSAQQFPFLFFFLVWKEKRCWGNLMLLLCAVWRDCRALCLLLAMQHVAWAAILTWLLCDWKFPELEVWYVSVYFLKA